MNKKIAKLLILLIAVMGITTQANADTRAGIRLLTSVPSAVSIEKTSQSQESGTVDVTTGVLKNSMSSVFTLRTNGSDDDYDYIMTSTVNIQGGTASGYGLSGGNTTLLFTNANRLPSEADVNNAKAGGNNNKDVIAYPVNVIITNPPMSAEFQQNYSTYGDCYVIKANNVTFGTIIQNVSQNPVSGTYRIGQDAAGSYKTTVTLTAVSKL